MTKSTINHDRIEREKGQISEFLSQEHEIESPQWWGVSLSMPISSYTKHQIKR